jgi:hypothetical protein
VLCAQASVEQNPEKRFQLVRRIKLQQRPPEQRHRLHPPEGHAGGGQQEIHAERDRKLEEARKQRQIRRQQAASWRETSDQVTRSALARLHQLTLTSRSGGGRRAKTQLS